MIALIGLTSIFSFGVLQAQAETPEELKRAYPTVWDKLGSEDEDCTGANGLIARGIVNFEVNLDYDPYRLDGGPNEPEPDGIGCEVDGAQSGRETSKPDATETAEPKANETKAPKKAEVPRSIPAGL